RPEPGTNICHQFHFARGDSAGALASADLVLDDTYRFPPVQHYAMEPHAAVAVWSETDGLTIWASSQNPYSVRVELAKMFDVPLARIRVVVPHLGGGFGSKTYAKLAPLAVYTNTTPGGAFRGFGVPQLAWALESLVDAAADRLGRDPVELRRQNFLAHGEEFAPGDTPIDGKLEESLSRAAEAIGWTRASAADRGRGVAAMLKASVAPSVSEAIVRLLRFGMSGGELIGRGVIVPGRTAAPLGGSTPFWEMAVGAAEVSVDEETGAVRVERYVSVADVGRAVNPLLLEGQDEGGVVQ